MKNVLKNLVCVSLVGLLVVCSGCGTKSDDPRTVHVKGTVTLNGKPIKSGKIMFSPNGTVRGPAGVASIVDGNYDTDSVGGKAVMTGPHRIDIENFVKVPGDGEEEIIEGEAVIDYDANPIPTGHREEWTVPEDSGRVTKDFAIETD